MIKKNTHLPLGKILSKFSGINFENLYSGVDVKSSVRIRGFGEQATRNILVLINGIRISDMTIAGANLSRIPTENINNPHASKLVKIFANRFQDGTTGAIIHETNT